MLNTTSCVFLVEIKKKRSIQFAATNQSVPKEFFKEQLEELSHQLLHHICFFFFGGGAIWTSEIIAKKGGTAAEEPPAELKEETPAEAEVGTPCRSNSPFAHPGPLPRGFTLRPMHWMSSWKVLKPKLQSPMMMHPKRRCRAVCC